MKQKIKNDLKGKTAEELIVESKKRREELIKLKTDVKSGKVKNTSSLKVKSDELATVLTLLKQKEMI